MLLLDIAHAAGNGDRFTAWREDFTRGGVSVQTCAVWASPESSRTETLRPCLRQIAAAHRCGAVVVTRQGDLDSLEENRGSIGLVLALEGAEPLEDDIELVEAFWQLGVRMFSLTWGRANRFAAGTEDDLGLTAAGHELVGRLLELGAILDLAHASKRTFYDVLELADGAPVIVSHAACHALNPTTARNLDDPQLTALKEHGGVFAVMSLPTAIGGDTASLDRVVDHIVHAVGVVGSEHVAVGADFVTKLAELGVYQRPSHYPADVPLGTPGFDSPEDYPALAARLAERGFTGEDIARVLGGNLWRVFRRSLPT
jgi:membrane dipeptidase